MKKKMVTDLSTDSPFAMGKRIKRGLIPSLPDVILEEILSRFPVKTLSRFQCVSKDWLRLISSPSFRQVRDRNPQRIASRFVLMWFCTRRSRERSLTLYVIDLLDGKLQCEFKLTRCYRSIWYSSSSHGLVYFSDERAKHIYVCNPSTHELVKLPVPGSASSRPPEVRVSMGFLPESNTYKFLVWFVDSKSLDCGFDIFDLTDGGKPRSSRWRTLKSGPGFQYRPQQVSTSKHVVINGVIYWVVGTAPKYEEWLAMLAFDLRTEKCKTIQPPADRRKRDGYVTSMVELRGSLCISQTSYLHPKGTGGTTVIWVLGEQDKWVQQYNIGHTLHRLITCVPAPACHQHGNAQDEDDLDLVFMLCSHPGLHYYNIKNKSVGFRSEPSWITSNSDRAFVYVDTLFSLNHCPSRRSRDKK